MVLRLWVGILSPRVTSVAEAIIAADAASVAEAITGKQLQHQMTGWFQAALTAHIVCAVVGFGGLLGLRWRDNSNNTSQNNGGALTGRSLWPLELAVYGVPIFGAAAIGFDNRFDFSQIWVTLGFLFYVLWVGIWHIALRPRSPAPDSPAPDSAVTNAPGGAKETPSRRIKGLAYGASDLLLVASIFVMVVKPGGL